MRWKFAIFTHINNRQWRVILFRKEGVQKGVIQDEPRFQISGSLYLVRALHDVDLRAPEPVVFQSLRL